MEGFFGLDIGFGAALGALGFGVLFNIHADKLFSVAFVGFIGGYLYDFIVAMGYSSVISLFFASVAIAALSELFARMLRTPVTGFLVCALIPLVPGGGMYYTMLEIVRDNLNGALVKGINTVAQACSIAIGVILVSSIMRMYNKFTNRG